MLGTHLHTVIYEQAHVLRVLGEAAVLSEVPTHLAHVVVAATQRPLRSLVVDAYQQGTRPGLLSPLADTASCASLTGHSFAIPIDAFFG
jgi:hypothetical protein